MDEDVVDLANFYKSHVAEHGKKSETYEKTLQAFIVRTPTIHSDISMPCKSIYDRFHKLISDRRRVIKVHEAAGGIPVVNKNLDNKLDNMISSIDAKAEKKRADQEALKQQEEELVQAANRLRDSTLGGLLNSDEDEAHNDDNDSTAISGKRLRFDSDEEDESFFREEVKKQDEYKVKKWRIEEERIELEKKRGEMEEIVLVLNERVTSLNEKKLKVRRRNENNS